MQNTLEQLQYWLAEPEGLRLEFKEAKNRYDFEKLVQYCVALANEGGGKIILGVTDQRPRRIVGTAAFEEPGRTEAGLHNRLSHRIPVEELQLPEGRVLVVHVPGRLPGSAWQIGGRYIKRAGDDLMALGDAELKAMFDETGPDFSAELCSGAGLGDLSPGAVALFRERWAKKTGDKRRHQWTDTETLTNAELLVDGQLTYAALILFGTHAALGRWLAQAEVVFEYRSSDASGPAGDRVEFREGFFAWHDRLWDKVNLRNDKQSYQDGLFRVHLLTFDEVPVREALLNAVAHRDYRLGGSVFVRQYPQRLEVVSPGGFPPGITVTNVLDQQNPRNRRLAEALAKCGLIERSGQGMNLMFETAIRQGKALPSFAGTTSYEVRLTLDGLHREQPLQVAMKERLSGLVDAGAVESMDCGKGTRRMLPTAHSVALDSKDTRKRKTGLDHEVNKAVLLGFLSIQGQKGALLADLRQVLPASSTGSLLSLMNELRKDGSVFLDGQRRSARWKLSTYQIYKAEDL